MTQSNLGDWGNDDPEPEVEPDAEQTVDHDREPQVTIYDRSSLDYDPLAPWKPGFIPPEKPEPGDLYCPWQHAHTTGEPMEEAVDRGNGVIGCGTCEARLPVDADWYKRGELAL